MKFVTSSPRGHREYQTETSVSIPVEILAVGATLTGIAAIAFGFVFCGTLGNEILLNLQQTLPQIQPTLQPLVEASNRAHNTVNQAYKAVETFFCIVQSGILSPSCRLK